MKKITKLVVSSGQYETVAHIETVKHTTTCGLWRRIKQLSRQYATYGDNYTGRIPASVAIASDKDKWGENATIGGKWCDPANGWIDFE